MALSTDIVNFLEALRAAVDRVLEKQEFSGQAPDSGSDVSEIHASSAETSGSITLPLSVDDDFSRSFADDHIACQFAKINATYEEIITRENSSARALFPFIRGKLCQYRLLPLYDEIAILQEVYSRTVIKILEGREIINQYAWIRSVAFRYIRELNRKHGRSTGIDESFLDAVAPVESSDEEFLMDEMLKMHRAFQCLRSFGIHYPRRVGISTYVIHLLCGRSISHGREHPSSKKLKAPPIRGRWTERNFRTYTIESGCFP